MYRCRHGGNNNRAVDWWETGVREAMRVGRRPRYASSNNTAEWEDYVIARAVASRIVEIKRRLDWKT